MYVNNMSSNLKVKKSYTTLVSQGLWDENPIIMKKKFHKFCLDNHPDKVPTQSVSDIDFATVSNCMDICSENMDLIIKEFVVKEIMLLDNLLCFKCNRKMHETGVCPFIKKKDLELIV